MVALRYHGPSPFAVISCRRVVLKILVSGPLYTLKKAEHNKNFCLYGFLYLLVFPILDIKTEKS